MKTFGLRNASRLSVAFGTIPYPLSSGQVPRAPTSAARIVAKRRHAAAADLAFKDFQPKWRPAPQLKLCKDSWCLSFSPRQSAAVFVAFAFRALFAARRDCRTFLFFFNRLMQLAARLLTVEGALGRAASSATFNFRFSCSLDPECS